MTRTIERRKASAGFWIWESGNGARRASPQAKLGATNVIEFTPLTPYLGMLPDPVALVEIDSRRFRVGQGDHAAIVRLIPANRIEHEVPVVRAAVLQRLPADDVVGQLFYKPRHQRGERFGILAERHAIAFERTDNERFIDSRLGSGDRFNDSSEVGSCRRGNESERGKMTECRLQLGGGFFLSVRLDDLVGRV